MVPPVVALVAGSLITCVSAHRDPEVNSEPRIVPPAGLDSDSQARWVDSVRRLCRGMLILILDEGTIGRNPSRDTFYFKRFVVGAVCRRR